MTGTALTRFEDELEYYGFQRPGLDLTLQNTVGEVIEKLSEQKDVVENLRSIVIFPRTKGYFKAKISFLAASRQAEDTEGLPITKSYAREYFTTLTNKEAEGSVVFEQVLGIPVFTCATEADFQALRPLEPRAVRPNTYVYSYVITRLGRLYPQGETQDIPLIVRRNGTSDKVVLQHARTQLAFARKVSPEDLSPVLASTSPLNFEEDVRQKVRAYLLSILVSQKQAVDWYKDEEEGAERSIKRSQLFPRNQKEIFGDEDRPLYMGQSRPLYMGHWLSKKQKALGLGRAERVGIFKKVNSQMEKDLGVIARLIQIKPSMTWQNFVANYLSLFDDWDGAEETFKAWEFINVFRDTFGATLPPSTDIFRDRAPQV